MILKNQWSLTNKLVAVISLCLFLQILICQPLWLENERFYPKILVFESIQFAFVDSTGSIFFYIILLCLISFIIGKANRFTISLFFISIIVLVLNDINRLQVWLYELTIMLSVLFISKNTNTKIATKALQVIIICVYWWSGIQKLNTYFVEDNFPWLMEPFGLDNLVSNYSFIAYFAAIIETLIGLGLLFKKTRPLAVILAFSLHLIILIILSPIGHYWNQAVWPWNVCMILLVYLLFYKNEGSLFKSTLKNFHAFLPFPIIIILFGIMPLFNFFDAWDEQLSFKMYSAVSPEGIFYYHEQQTKCIPSIVKEKFVHVTPSTKDQRIILDDWIFFELKVAPYKSKKRLLQVGEELCHCFEKPELAGLEILEVNRWNRENDRITKYPCSSLLKKEY